ncbi:hypothetical protein PENSUB_1898 [Penicillium subrubescens]|uniref:Uncharacterized protein n=1 Tax=Penicillium subrubescens TaxID=1316194 RepID=A0A1Q5UJA3_9EURO|nr:hypothetical protein PENSUB_1898 [Penicillium subrubescens]
MATLTPTPRITLSPPNHHASKSPNPKNKAPSIDFLTGTWHVTHSSLPLWKDKRNVKITYTPIPTNTTTNNAAGGDLTKLDDLVQYQSRNPSNPKIHTVHGVDTPSQSNPGAWDWRGKGWLLIASSNWEVLGFGYEPKTGTVTEGEEELGNAWHRRPMGIEAVRREGHFPGQMRPTGLRRFKGIMAESMSDVSDSCNA